MKLSMVRLAGGLVVALGLVAPALATETMHCAALDDSETYVEMNLGFAAVESPTWIRIGTGDEFWTSLAPDLAEDPAAVAVTIAQSFSDARGLAVDVADDNVNNLLASVRIFRIEEVDTIHQYGWLQLHGRSVHPIACDGP